MKIVDWVKKNLLSVLLLVIIVLLLLPNSTTVSRTLNSSKSGVSAPMMGTAEFMPPIQDDYAPQADVAQRLVIQNSNLSLQVKDVAKTRDAIIAYAKEQGGYMVDANTENPEESPTGNVTIRVPAQKLTETLAYMHGLAIKVVSENLFGYDVTDQYVDIDKRIEILEKTMAKFESILGQATEISDITNLNREIINIQSQIDSFKGRQEALAQNAELAKISVYLATDEIALPYAPTETWRPSVIFKLAVRGVVTDLRGIGTKLIWLFVYSIFWVPALVVAYFIYRFFSKKH